MELIYNGLVSKKLWLEYIANKFGDFKIAFSKKVNGQHIYYKHRSIIECSSDENLSYLFKQCNHRQIQPYEIVIDLDDEESIAGVDKICDLLEKYKETYFCFSTGSKGYHIHIIEKQFSLSVVDRQVIRTSLYEIIKEDTGFEIDFHKSSDKVLIAMENTPHWKTGNKKSLYRKGE